MGLLQAHFCTDAADPVSCLETAAGSNVFTPLGRAGLDGGDDIADVEPEPGKFNFDTMERIVATARREGFRLVLLWFAT